MWKKVKRGIRDAAAFGPMYYPTRYSYYEDESENDYDINKKRTALQSQNFQEILKYEVLIAVMTECACYDNAFLPSKI